MAKNLKLIIPNDIKTSSFYSGEQLIRKSLDDLGIIYECHKYINEGGKKYYIDFVIESKKIWIEYNGHQHYFPIKLWGGEERLKLQIERDKEVEKNK